jgi:hypothetical protein
MSSHYSDKHKGLCLGFDVKEAPRVEYTPTRLIHAIGDAGRDLRVTVELIKVALLTKFEEWSYERERRLFCDFEDQVSEPNGNFYHAFDDQVALREVLIGHRCKLSPKRVAQWVGSPMHDVTIIKVRPSFKEFKMVQQMSVDKLIIKGTRSAS